MGETMRMTDFTDRAALARVAGLGVVGICLAAAIFAIVVGASGTASAVDGHAGAGLMRAEDATGLAAFYALGLIGVHGGAQCVACWFTVLMLIGVVVGMFSAVEVVLTKAADRLRFRRGVR
jgi:amino acid transporter